MTSNSHELIELELFESPLDVVFLSKFMKALPEPGTNRIYHEPDDFVVDGTCRCDYNKHRLQQRSVRAKLFSASPNRATQQMISLTVNRSSRPTVPAHTEITRAAADSAGVRGYCKLAEAGDAGHSVATAQLI